MPGRINQSFSIIAGGVMKMDGGDKFLAIVAVASLVAIVLMNIFGH